jgi:hypothetical protein
MITSDGAGGLDVTQKGGGTISSMSGQAESASTQQKGIDAIVGNIVGQAEQCI